MSILGLVFRLDADCRAQDRVTYTPEGASRPITAIGEVLNFTGRGLSLRSPNGSVQQIPPDRVEGIETAYEPAHLRGIGEFAAGRIELAQTSFREALDREQREWVDREILAWLVKCAHREQNLSGALVYFRELVRTDPDTPHWGIAPLVWAPLAVSPAVRTDARRWLKAGGAPDQLLAASLLLTDAGLSTDARRKLMDLSRNPTLRISACAKAQLWRLDLASRDVNETTLERWRSQIEHLPPDVRSGPQYLLARGYLVHGELRRAAAEFLWNPFLFPAHEVLAARSLSDAADSLEQTGLTAEAEVLYRELIGRYAWSREAAQARSRAATVR